MLNQLYHSTLHLFLQLEQVLNQLTDEEFNKAEPILGNATIGQHVRHILEFYTALFEGYPIEIINYDGRKRNLLLETCRNSAIAKFTKIKAQIKQADRKLVIKGSLLTTNDDTILIPTSYFRELMYNLEHAMHHMALISVGIRINTNLILPENFGVAASTIKNREACAQ